MNIPRYVEAIDEEIPQDVDAHLFGGIPQQNIDGLKVLQSTVPDILNASLQEVRKGYVELVKPVKEISTLVFDDPYVLEKSKELEAEITNYIHKYFDTIRSVESISTLPQLMENMLIEIKEILSAFDNINVYDGYQIIAEIWKESLSHDTEVIALSDFYKAGRTREPNMVTKGSGKTKRVERDGWIGSIVPNALVEKQLYRDELEEIESKKSRMQEIEAELADLVEAAKAEDSEESSALGDTLNEAGEAFDSKALKAELKQVVKNSSEYKQLKHVEQLLSEKASLGREVKAHEKTLKEVAQERILTLTDDEIDTLMYEKWFGNTVNSLVRLIEIPLKKELDTLQMLHDRYADTLSAIDEESRDLESAFEALMSELVVKS